MTVVQTAQKIADALEDYNLIRWKDKGTANMIVLSFLKDYEDNRSKTLEDGVDLESGQKKVE